MVHCKLLVSSDFKSLQEQVDTFPERLQEDEHVKIRSIQHTMISETENIAMGLSVCVTWDRPKYGSASGDLLPDGTRRGVI